MDLWTQRLNGWAALPLWASFPFLFGWIWREAASSSFHCPGNPTAFRLALKKGNPTASLLPGGRHLRRAPSGRPVRAFGVRSTQQAGNLPLPSPSSLLPQAIAPARRRPRSAFLQSDLQEEQPRRPAPFGIQPQQQQQSFSPGRQPVLALRMGAAAGALGKTVADGSGNEEEEEQQCRICRHPAEPERPLRHPCACRGSIRFVHEDCQLQWLSTTRQRRCEVCGQEISIRPIHGADASALARLASLIVSLLCLILTVKVAWELTSLYLWRLALARSRAEAFRLLSVRPFEPPVLAQLALRAGHVFHAKYGGRRSRCQVAVLCLLQFSVAVRMVDMVLACTFAFIPFTLGRIILLCTGEFDSFAATSSVLLVGYGFIFSLALGATFAWLLHTTGGVFPRLARGFRALCHLPELAWDFCVYDLDKYVVDEPIVIGQRLEDVADGR